MMPTLSIFYGIVVYMYWQDHNPPHIHAEYGDYEALFDLEGNVIKGDLPKKQEKLVAGWIVLREKEILENWKRAQARQPLFRIEPI